MKSTVRLRNVFAAAALSLFTASASASLIFKIDIDHVSADGTVSATEAGWTSLAVDGYGANNADSASRANDSSVLVDGVRFDVFSADGSRDRGAVTNDLTSDFIYDDGIGVAVGLQIFGLPGGIWEASVYSYDGGVGTGAGNQIIGVTQFGAAPEDIYTTSFASNEATPFTFRFNSSNLVDGFGVFARENNQVNRSRFNALVLRRVPAPAPLLLLGVGLVSLGWFRRGRR